MEQCCCCIVTGRALVFASLAFLLVTKLHLCFPTFAGSLVYDDGGLRASSRPPRPTTLVFGLILSFVFPPVYCLLGTLPRSTHYSALSVFACVVCEFQKGFSSNAAIVASSGKKNISCLFFLTSSKKNPSVFIIFLAFVYPEEFCHVEIVSP